MKTIIACGMILMGHLSLQSHAADRLALSAGLAASNTNAFRASWQHDFQYRWMQSPTGQLELRGELALTQLRSSQQQLNIVSALPVFSYRFNLKNRSIHPYLEGGVGAAYVSDRRFEERELGSLWLFEDRIGGGIRFEGGHDVNLCYLHHSNANLADENDGLNVYLLSYSFEF